MNFASLQAKRSTAQNHQPPEQSQTASTQQAKAQSRAAVPKQSSHAGREPRRTCYSAFPARIPAVAESGTGAGKLDHEPDQQVADDSSVSSQSHREVVTGDRPTEQRPKREDTSQFVEVPQVHDIDKIVSSRCVETEEVL